MANHGGALRNSSPCHQSTSPLIFSFKSVPLIWLLSEKANINERFSLTSQSRIAFVDLAVRSTPLIACVSVANTNSQINTCPLGQKACCYDPSVDHSVFGRSCIAPGASASQFEAPRYGCNERVVNSGKQCGTRNFPAPA